MAPHIATFKCWVFSSCGCTYQTFGKHCKLLIIGIVKCNCVPAVTCRTHWRLLRIGIHRRRAECFVVDIANENDNYPRVAFFILNLKASLFNYPSWAIYSRIDGQSVTLYISPEVNLAGMCYQHVIVISVNIGIVFYWLRPCLLVWLNVCLSAAYLPVTKVIRSKPRRTKANKVAVYQTSAV